MTGRAAGFCAGYPAPGYMNSVGGCGFWGRGRGFGGRGGDRGRRNRFFATGLPGWARAGFDYPAGFAGVAPTAEQQREALKQKAQYLQDSLDAINKHINDLEKEKSE
jgi:hypothetical protein